MNFFKGCVSFIKTNFQKVAAAAVVVVGGSAIIAPTAAHADLATDLGTIKTAATDGIALVSTSQATVIAAVFGLILLAVGFKWIVSSLKGR